MASIDFDSVLDFVGAEGRYQTVLYYLLCIPATVPAAFLGKSRSRLFPNAAISMRVKFSLKATLFFFFLL